MASSASPTTPTSTSVDPASAARIAEFTRALGAYDEKPGAAETRAALLAAARALMVAIGELPKRDMGHPLVAHALAAARRLGGSGIQDYPVTAEDQAWLDGRDLRSWQTIIGAMLLGAAWQWRSIPNLEAVPQWLWADYSLWLFRAPQGFVQPGDAERYAAFILPHLENLAGLVERAYGSIAVRAAAEAYVSCGSSVPLYFVPGNLRRHAEARGRIFKRVLAREATPFEAIAYPRTGRRLRVGVLNRHFGPQTETYTTLPTFEQLDPDRFEVILFSLRPADSPLASYCANRAREYRVLPDDFKAQLATLREANLDVLVFGTNLTAIRHQLSALALHRIAPLQVVNNSSCITTGFPTIDLYVSGDLTETADAAEQFSERLGLLPGPAHAFNYNADAQEPTVNFTRQVLGVPDDAVLFVTAANYFKIIPEMQQAWAKLLAEVPGSRLLVHPFNPNWSSKYPIDRFSAEFDQVLAAHGVDSKRLLISSGKFPSRTDVRELMRVGDIYLDTYPFGGVNSLVDPLEVGIPTVVWEGDTFRSRMGSALLRTLQLPELIANGESAYLALAKSLAGDRERRAALSTRIRAAMERVPVFLDTLAASDAFGDLLEAAFDELAEVGIAEFRSRRGIIRAPQAASIDETLQAGEFSLEVGAAVNAIESARTVLRGAPNHATARWLLGRAYLGVGDPKRAVDYLVAAVPHAEANAALWIDTARALRAAGRMPDAVQALQTALNVDRTRLDGWIMFVELAHQIGSNEIAREALSVARELGRDDPRITSLEIMVA